MKEASIIVKRCVHHPWQLPFCWFYIVTAELNLLLFFFVCASITYIFSFISCRFILPLLHVQTHVDISLEHIHTITSEDCAAHSIALLFHTDPYTLDISHWNKNDLIDPKRFFRLTVVPQYLIQPYKEKWECLVGHQIEINYHWRLTIVENLFFSFLYSPFLASLLTIDRRREPMATTFRHIHRTGLV